MKCDELDFLNLTVALTFNCRTFATFKMNSEDDIVFVVFRKTIDEKFP